MQNDVSNLRDTIVVKSDQLNADDLLGGPITITVTKVSRADGDQPVAIHFEGDGGKPFKPCKSMRKVLLFAWGDDGRAWSGKSMTLYNDPEVKFGGIKVGGIRISHLSDIERDIAISLTSTKGKKAPVTIKKLTAKPKVAANQNAATAEQPPQPDQAAIDAAKAKLTKATTLGMDALVKEWKATPANVRKVIGPDGCPQHLKDAAAAADEAMAAQQPTE